MTGCRVYAKTVLFPRIKSTGSLSEVHVEIFALISHGFSLKTKKNHKTFRQLFQHAPHLVTVCFYAMEFGTTIL